MQEDYTKESDIIHDDTASADNADEKLFKNLERKEQLKNFFSSNMGITVIAVFVAIVLGGINYWSKHASSTLNDKAVTNNAFNTQVDNPSGDTKAPGFDKDMAPAHAAPEATHEDIAHIQAQLNQLLAAVNTNTQLIKELALKTSESTQKKTSQAKHIAKPSYQLLGTYLDQTTNQWTAQVLFRGQIHNITQGDTLSGCHVKSVTKQGVVIR